MGLWGEGCNLALMWGYTITWGKNQGGSGGIRVYMVSE